MISSDCSRDFGMGACLITKKTWISFFQISHLEHIYGPQAIPPASPNEHMTNLESQGDILGFINPFADWKQLICFLTAADLHGSDSLPQDKETIDFVFQISHLDHTLWSPSYPPCLPQQTYDKSREPERHIGLYKTVYRF